ncbi:LicD family protein [Anaerofustis sp. NSJ-163]|nr:LicD family protein [Anaerofustis sp. NSJ-163]MCO8194452.1 LicD family protein [Anaerofustis sp. NSJ-163]
MINLDSLEIKSNADKVFNVIKQLELDILEEIDKICRKNKIEYSIGGGTMLGAIRHGGFIPWDDDIDIELTAENYEKLIEACKKDLNTKKYTLLTNETNPKFNDFPAKILLKNTIARSKSARNANLPLTLCVDIFKLDNMPNDFEKRKEIAHKLFNLRQCMFCKTYNNITFLKDPNDRQGKNLKYIKYVSRPALYKKIKKLEKQCNELYKDSDYLYDNCIYHVGYYGEPNFDKTGYEDVKFENLTVRKFKQHHEYLCNLFGDDYMEMPPVESRMTHHNYVEFDLGPYAKMYDLPDDYEKYMINSLDGDRLSRMKNLCLDMLDEVDRICKKYDIKYFLSGDDLIFKAKNIEEMSNLWRKDVGILMDFNNLKKFNSVVENELDEKYFYQTEETDSEYFYAYPKIRLKDTYLKDKRLVPAKINEGLWINIGIMVNAPNDPVESENYYKQIKSINSDIELKCLFDEVRTRNLKRKKISIRRSVIRSQIKKHRKAKRINELKNVSLKELKEKRKKLYNKYENINTDYVVDISTTMLNMNRIKKEYFSEGKRDTLLGHVYNFPSNYKAICNDFLNIFPNREKKYDILFEMKNTEKDKYDEAVNKGTEKFLININKKHPSFNLSIYDIDEYKLSVLDL